ncbi:excinuclease ABC subunit A [Enteractinococcus fodinae]|uniref:UvrABC system protein A n=1 Tax=Enteractinococcus fodinae TaxID=684663 RepID=A0ABU2B3U1_9MICC|nr:excinuclease ABC subunit UvrA [Enteractinococcus fodinae]MDR7348284.1 excinuclease ABC subunit A [Enteractinococcus fodinae]
MTTPQATSHPTHIHVRGARVNNLQNIDVDIPLNQLVGIVGVSGSGKSSLAMGTLYAEGSRRYLEALSTYTRRRMAATARAAVDSVSHIPPALALRQRPGTAGVRSTFGTSTELLNVVRLIFSRLAEHRCPHCGMYAEPTIKVALEQPIRCTQCDNDFDPPGAEELAFNSEGACPACAGTGITRQVDETSLVPDPTKTIDDGAVAPWNQFGFNVQPQIVAEFGVRTDVPFQELTEDEREIVFHGPEEKKAITVTSRKGVHDLDFTFRNVYLTVTKELERATDAKRLQRVSKFLIEKTCPDCAGTRLSEQARQPRIGEHNLASVSALPLADLLTWVASLQLPEQLTELGRELTKTLQDMGTRLLQLGLGYLSLDRTTNTLSNGERQRAQLARAVRNETTGVLYVLDEPSIGLHPANIEGLVGVMHDLLAGGNSVVFVDHDVAVIQAADYLIEIGPGSGAHGGTILTMGRPKDLAAATGSVVGPHLQKPQPIEREPRERAGWISMQTQPLHTVEALDVRFPTGVLTVVTGVSGSGKTTLVLESLIPALNGANPEHVQHIAGDIDRVIRVDASPIGINVRSTVATYSGIMDQLRTEFAKVSDDYTAADFSYNTGSLKCPECDGNGQISLDAQFLADIEMACPSCEGSRYRQEASNVQLEGHSMPEVLALTAQEAADLFADYSRIARRLKILIDLGLGYLTLGEATPALSGGEAQRLKLSTELGRNQQGTLFVLDEPSVGLHPDDVAVLVGVLDRLLERGATVIVIEHDLDIIAAADWIIDLGPGGGADGGRIVATGTPGDVAAAEASLTGRYLRPYLDQVSS